MIDVVKQVIVVRTDLGMSVGKTASQVAHASMKGILQLGSFSPSESLTDDFFLSVERESALAKWIFGAFTKVVVCVSSEEELFEIYNKAKEDNINVALIKDCGKTEFKGISTNTCIAIGPNYSSLLDKYTGHLKLLK